MNDKSIQSTPEPIDFSVGKVLKDGREAHGLSFEDVADKLKLTPRQLTALESDDFQALPGNTFVRGFVRNYARLLEIDPQPLIEHLVRVLPQERVQAAMPRVGDATALNANSYFGHQTRWSVWLMVVLGLLLGVGVVFWYLQQPKTPEVAMPVASTPAMVIEPGFDASATAQERASAVDASSFIMLPTASQTASSPVSSVERSAPLAALDIAASRVASATVSASAIKPSAAGSTTDGNSIRVATESDSWVQIIDADGQMLVSQLLGSGTNRSVSGKPPFRIKVGNAPKTQLYYRGQLVDLKPYIRGDVASLDLK
ncbi:MAG: DUF4115 domain-containing protein [Formivibrio sp.]|nr:DUF4115 domain-containing protein [Formivibrio sp.]